MTVADIRRKTAEKMGGNDGANQPCMVCQTPTPWATLSNFGARCERCYACYCRMPISEFNARTKGDQPKLAMPRREVKVDASHIGQVMARPSSPEQIRAFADELGIDVEGAP